MGLLVLRHTRRRPRARHSHPHSFVSRSVMLMRRRFVLRAENGRREAGVPTRFSLLEVLKQICLCVWEKYKAHINAGIWVCFFFLGGRKHVGKWREKSCGSCRSFFLFFSHIDWRKWSLNTSKGVLQAPNENTSWVCNWIWPPRLHHYHH